MKQLSQNMMDSGKRFIELLMENSASPEAAFWIYNPDLNQWMFLVGHVNGIDDNDAAFNQLVKSIYQSNQGALPELGISDISLAQENAPILELLNSVVNTGDEILGINFVREEINGTIIDGVYLYRMNITALAS